MTSTCGIDCNVCRLKLLGSCSSCGPGKSIEAAKKIEAQKRIFGNTCPILSCAALNNVDYCMRDCSMFPCSNFYSGYPFSERYLAMQKRRRQILPVALTPNGDKIEVPDEYWCKLAGRDSLNVCNMTMVESVKDKKNGYNYTFAHLNRKVFVDSSEKKIRVVTGDETLEVKDPLLELLSLLYLITIEKFRLFRKELTTLDGLGNRYIFENGFPANMDGVRERFENDLKGFCENALFLGGEEVDMADKAFVFHPFPRTPVYYLLWLRSKEHHGRISVLFERSIENYFSPSAVWALINLINRELIGCGTRFEF